MADPFANISDINLDDNKHNQMDTMDNSLDKA